jgi:hypothetical protein
MALPLAHLEHKADFGLITRRAARLRKHAPALPHQRVKLRRAAPVCRAAMPATNNLEHDTNTGDGGGDGGGVASEVVVYCGEGAGQQSVRNTMHALQSCMAPGVQVRP